MENKFEWTDELVKEMLYSKLPLPMHYVGNVQKCLDEFKDSKQPKLDYEIIQVNDPTCNLWSTWQQGFVPLLKNGWVIEKVKRLSDNEIFTIGDKVKNLTDFDFRENCEIVRFYIFNNALVCDLKNSNGVRIKFSLSLIEKIVERTILFTTEDNIKIYEEDRYWTVSPLEFYLVPHIASSSDNPHYHGDKAFSTEEKAKEYIMMNKPCLSVNDVMNEEKGAWGGFNVALSQLLIKLAKQKLNKL